MIDNLDLGKLDRRDPSELTRLTQAVGQVGFLTVTNTGLDGDRIRQVIETYRDFFHLSEVEKARVDMAATGSNRGWGAPQSEQVDPEANPDFKEVFDCGFELPSGNPYEGQGKRMKFVSQCASSEAGLISRISASKSKWRRVYDVPGITDVLWGDRGAASGGQGRTRVD